MFPSLHNFIFKCQPMYGGERMEQNVWYLSATSFANVCRIYYSQLGIKSSPLWLNANGAMNDILWCLSGTVQCFDQVSHRQNILFSKYSPFSVHWRVALNVWLVDTEVETNNVADDSVGSDLFLCDKIVTSPGDSKLALTVIRLIVAAVFVTICFRCITGVTMCGATQQAVPSAAVSLLSWRTLS